MARDEEPDRPAERDSAAFFDTRPPHWAARGLAVVLLLLFVTAAVLSVVVRLPETVSSAFVLVPVRGADPIRAPLDGTVAEVRTADAQPVTKDQVLFVIRSTAIGGRTADLRALEAQRAGAEESLANARRKFESERRVSDAEGRRLEDRRAHVSRKIDAHRALRAVRDAKYEASVRIAETEIEAARSETEFKTQHLTLAREVAERSRKGYESGYLSWQEYIRPQIEATRVAVDLEQLNRQLAVSRLKLRQLRADRENEEADWQRTMAELEAELGEVRTATAKLSFERDRAASELRELERRIGEERERAAIRIGALTQALVQTKGNEQFVSAPCAGVLLRLSVRAPGALVREGEPLAELACGGERLQAELQVPQSGVSRVGPGQTVKLFYAAFPYERFGVRYGTIRWVSPVGAAGGDAAGRKGDTFRALADVADEAIPVDGTPRTLVAGMGGRAEVLLSRQTLLSYAFEPLRKLRENLAGGPAR